MTVRTRSGRSSVRGLTAALALLLSFIVVGVVWPAAGVPAPTTLGFGVAAETVLPKLTGSIAESFEGGAYTTQTFKAGTTFYRAEGSGQGIGSFLGLSKPTTAADAEKLFNIAKWGNNADVVTTYRLTQDTTMYVGDVAGGAGRQALLPRGASPGSLFQQLGQEPLP